MKPNELFGKIDTPQLSALLILLATGVSLFAANSAHGLQYISFWELRVPMLPFHKHPVTFSMLINDVLMPLFFLLIGLEIREELETGALSNIKSAMLPVIAALGGMMVPALIYTGFNFGSSTARGWGIPMATDIAFALAVMSVLGNRVPTALKVFLTTLAVVDDLGAVLVIALFYTAEIHVTYLAAAIGSAFLLWLAGRRWGLFFPVLAGGLLLWYFTFLSGIHTTIAGVVLAFCIPDEKSDKEGWLQRFLHLPVNLFVLPVFALSATAISLHQTDVNQLFSPIVAGIVCGLIAGKTIGIFCFARLSVRFRLAELSPGIQWRGVFGASVLGGIGFTMSIFIASLAFSDGALTGLAKVAVLFGSAVSAVTGASILTRSR